MVTSHMSQTMQEKAKFEGFTYKGATKLWFYYYLMIMINKK
jgi:hypothetical protein